MRKQKLKIQVAGYQNDEDFNPIIITESADIDQDFQPIIVKPHRKAKPKAKINKPKAKPRKSTRSMTFVKVLAEDPSLLFRQKGKPLGKPSERTKQMWRNKFDKAGKSIDLKSIISARKSWDEVIRPYLLDKQTTLDFLQSNYPSEMKKILTSIRKRWNSLDFPLLSPKQTSALAKVEKALELR